MASSNSTEQNGSAVDTLEMLLHVLSHEVESQAYLQMAIRTTSDHDLKALLIDILGQEQLHETKLRSKIRDKFSLDV